MNPNVEQLDHELTAVLQRRAGEVHAAPRGFGDIRDRWRRRRQQRWMLALATTSVACTAMIAAVASVNVDAPSKQAVSDASAVASEPTTAPTVAVAPPSADETSNASDPDGPSSSVKAMGPSPMLEEDDPAPTIAATIPTSDAAVTSPTEPTPTEPQLTQPATVSTPLAQTPTASEIPAGEEPYNMDDVGKQPDADWWLASGSTVPVAFQDSDTFTADGTPNNTFHEMGAGTIHCPRPIEVRMHNETDWGGQVAWNYPCTWPSSVDGVKVELSQGFKCTMGTVTDDYYEFTCDRVIAILPE